MYWGILAPDTIISQRRQQNLGLASAVRHFNDRSVPGLGGMWFPMPILWSVLAVSIAEELRVPALPVGNAIEALMMRQAKEGPADRRVRGARKMQGLEDWSFKNLKRRGTYVVQPIRMAMVQPLVALSFVRGSRYGAFAIHTAGAQMLNLPVMANNRRVLGAWAHGGGTRGLNEVVAGLSPNAAVPNEVRKLILARLIGSDDFSASRRRALVELGTGPSAGQLDATEPLSGITPDHWTDLRAGAAFMDLRNAALAVLYRLEHLLLQLRDANELAVLSVDEASKVVGEPLAALRQCARQKGDRIDAGAEATSQKFLSEVRNLPVPQLVQKLADREGTVIRWRDGRIGLGPAAGEVFTSDESEPFQDEEFAPQLFRLYNLHCVATELNGGVNPGCRDAADEEPT
ncbi:hypothetical protein IMCC20628_03076 [Hoeflea sp. IMCC20628]|uniref:hypothetical protein n=1 Tax=Hoeflea sp. IMCC20628 TaxID=1620421 RepID=UPI00063AF739|nr:hypothetical protein [Hoeflea sp. IMCC20628]AKI01769.1 hypothetical protein IMCC20628_03076 [Hoeflea sp. IMCC20628]